MKFKIKLIVNPGDQKVGRAGISVTEGGVTKHDLIILEGEKVDAEVDIDAGGRIIIDGLDRPVVFDMDQKAAVPLDLTPDDPLADPNRPKPTPQPGTPGDLPRFPPDKDKSPQPTPVQNQIHGKDKPPESGKTDMSKTIDTSKTEHGGGKSEPPKGAKDDMHPPGLKK